MPYVSFHNFNNINILAKCNLGEELQSIKNSAHVGL